jgi:hypothetical protein
MNIRPHTIHDLLTLDHARHRFEVLDGTLIVSPAPGYDHQPYPGRSHDHQVPIVLAHELHEGTYRLVECLSAGRPRKIMRPFPVEFDPAELLGEDWPQTWSPE